MARQHALLFFRGLIRGTTVDGRRSPRMRSWAGIATIPLTTMEGTNMQVSALAEALTISRRPDGTISLHQLQVWLSRAGLEELARAVALLPERASLAKQDAPDAPVRPWL